jgi:hypothetical protein
MLRINSRRVFLDYYPDKEDENAPEAPGILGKTL